MKRLLWILVVGLILPFNLFSQQVETYKVVKGDTWYSIARKLKLSYAELRLANKNSGDKIKPGQTISIPAPLKVNDPYFLKNSTNESKSSEHQKKERLHVVSRSETLFGIAKKYKVSVKDIKEWNNLKSSSISKGQVLKIRLSVSDEQLKSGSETSPPPSEISNETNVKEPVPPSVKTSTGSSTLTSPILSGKQITFAKGRKEVNETGVAAWIEDEGISSGKYYALHPAAPIGTIIKVINPMNERYVFVKVVGKLPPTGDNEGLLIKISKSGADKLGVIDARFQAHLVYGIAEAAEGK